MQTLKRNKLFLSVSIIFFWYAQYVYVPYQTPYLFSLNAAASFIGIIGGAYGFTQMALRIPLGIFADRYNRQKIFIIAGVLFSAAASLLRMLFPTPVSFLIANMLSGIASATWISFTVFYSSLFSDSEIKKSMGYLIALNNGGILLGFVSGAVINDTLGIQMVFAASVASGVLGLLFSLFIREPRAPRVAVADIRPLKIFSNKPLIYYSLLALSAQAIIMSTALSFTTSYIKQLTNQEFLLGLCSAIFIISSVIVSLYIGYIKRLGRRTLIALFFACLLVYCALMPLASRVWQVCLLQVAAGLGNGGLISLLMAYSLESFKKESRGTAAGFFQAVYGIGMTLGPMLMGALIGTIGYGAGYWALAFLAAVSIAAVFIIRVDTTKT